MTALATSRFLRGSELKRPEIAGLRAEFERLYTEVLRKAPEAFGAKDPASTKIHWSRDWEYPWAILSSNPKSGEKVLDCGCGGSPLLPYLSQLGCDAFGADPGLGERSSFVKHVYSALKDQVWAVRSGKLGFARAALAWLGQLKPTNDLWRNTRDPNRLGFRIQYVNDSLDHLRFADNEFDKVYCISVIEHLPEQVAYQGMREMARVLKPGGLLTMTVDYDGDHVTPELVGKFQRLIQESGLRLHGEADFSLPSPEEVPGVYQVVGFVLTK